MWFSLRQKIGRFQKPTKFTLLALALLAIVSLYSSALGILALSIFLSYKFLSTSLSHKIFDSKSFVFVLSFFFYAITSQSVVIVSWLLSKDFPLGFTGLLTLLLLFGLYVSSKHKSTGDVAKRARFTRGDIAAFLVGLVVIGIAVILPLRSTGIGKESSVFVLINNAVDDSSHIGLLNDRIQFDRGVILGSTAEGHTRSDGIRSYPAGWHSANAIIIKAFNPPISTGVETVIAYILSKIFWFIFLVFIFIRTIFSLYAIYAKKQPSIATSIWISGASLLVTGWFLIDPFFEGFYSFLPQLISIPIFLLTLIQITFLQKKLDHSLVIALVFPVLLCACTALSWLLLFPVFLLTLLLCLVDRSIKIGIPTMLKELYTGAPSFLFFYGVIVLSVLVQAYVTTKGAGLSVSFVEGILLGGGIATYPITFYGFIFIGCILFLLLAIRLTTQEASKPIINYILASLAFAGMLYVIQLYAVHTNLYYYFKALNTFTIVGIMLCIIGFSLAIDWIRSQTSTSFSIASSLILLLISLQFVHQNPPVFGYIKGTRAMSSATNDQVLHIFNTSYSQNNYNNNEVILFYPDDSPTLNEVGSMLLKSNKPHSTCFTALKTASFATPPTQFSVDPIIRECSSQDIHITYYANPHSVIGIQEIIKAAHLENKVNVLPIRY